jgi:hypothetical protein
MAAKKRVAKAGAKAGKTAVKARYNPYIQRVVEDEDLRTNLLDAFESAKSAYARLSNGKSPTSQIFDDKKLQKDIREAAFNVRDATVTLRDAPKKRRRGGIGRLLLLVLVAAVAAVALSEGLRKKVLDTLFGAEEEFEYTSSTTPGTPAASTPTAGSTTT